MSKKIKPKNHHNQFLMDKMIEHKNRCFSSSMHKVSFIYQKIIQSLQKYPMPIICEDQVSMLQGVGDKTAIMLLQLIKQRYKDYEVGFQKLNCAIIEDNLQAIAEDDEEFDLYAESCPPAFIYIEEPQKRKEIPNQSQFAQNFKKYLGTFQVIEEESKNKKPFKPGKDSKGGQILLGLHQFSKSKNKLFASKKEIRDELREQLSIQFSLCNVEVQNWSAIEKLEQNSLICKQLLLLIRTVLDNEVKYGLTEEGTKLGEQFLLETRLQSKKQKVEQPEKIILLIDNRERYQNQNRSIFHEKLTQIYKIDCEMRQLPVGDFMWICKKGEEEYVCDYIIERKTICDLANSILDKRYNAQKYRLKHCGISNLFYLIENTYTSNLSVPKDKVDKAMRNTQIRDGFFIKQTENVEESLRWLTIFTKRVKLHEKPLKYSEFNFNNSKKAESLYNLWGSMLRGIQGVGLETAKVIANIWRTPIEFFEAVNKDKDKSLEKLVEETCLKKPQVASNVFRSIDSLFTKDKY